MRTWTDTPRRRSMLGVALGVAVVAVLLVIDVALAPGHVPIGLFVVAPLAAATVANPWATAAVGTVAASVALGVGLADDLPSNELRWRWTTVVIGAVLAVFLAEQRRRRTEADERARQALVQDLEARRQADVLAATQRLVQRLEDAQRVGRMGSWEHDVVEDQVRWSDGMARLVGAAPGSVTRRRDAARYVAAADAERLRALYAKAMSDGEPFEYAQRMVHRDGHELLTIVVGEGVRDEEGRLVSVRGITRDITEERRTAELLDEMRDQLVATDRVVDALQRSMLPQVLPIDPRVEIAAVYRPVDEVAEIGGDWYDAFPVVDGELGLSIGDVAGHGLEATALMAHARLALRWEGYSGSSPGAALARVDRMLELETGGRTFATAIFGRYRLGDGDLTWSRAGHCPPILLSGGETRSVESCGGPPLAAGLGLDPFDEAHMTLQRSDTVFFYTDGLVERRRRPFDIGLERLCAVLEGGAPDDDLAALVTSLPDQLSDAGALEDDCCILALRRLS